MASQAGRPGESLTKAEQKALNDRIKAEKQIVVAEKTGLAVAQIVRAKKGEGLRVRTLNTLRNFLAGVETATNGTKPHWTQTPAGKAKARKALKKANLARQLKREANGNGSTTHENQPNASSPSQKEYETSYNRHLTYAYGRAQGWIIAYAEAVGLPGRDFAHRVGELLTSSD